MCPFTTQIEGEIRRWRGKYGGERGIRTLGRALRPYDGLANRWFKPLTHLSKSEGGRQKAKRAEMIPTARADSTTRESLLLSAFCFLISTGGGGGIRTHGPGHPG